MATFLTSNVVRQDAAAVGRRSLIRSAAAILAGAATPVPAMTAEDPDAELIEACNRFFVADRDMAICETEEESEEIIARWYAEMERVTALPAMTAEGRRAKTKAAYLAMRSLEDFELSREERLAWSALADLAGGAPPVAAWAEV